MDTVTQIGALQTDFGCRRRETGARKVFTLQRVGAGIGTVRGREDRQDRR